MEGIPEMEGETQRPAQMVVANIAWKVARILCPLHLDEYHSDEGYESMSLNHSVLEVVDTPLTGVSFPIPKWDADGLILWVDDTLLKGASFQLLKCDARDECHFEFLVEVGTPLRVASTQIL